MEVASAKRGVRGPFNERDESEDDESAVPVRWGLRLRAGGRFLSSAPCRVIAGMVCVVED
jgi:hypothetical protein